MSKFKVGDRVRIVSGSSARSIGKTGVVTRVWEDVPHPYYVQYDGGQPRDIEPFSAEHIETLAPTPTPAEKLRAAAEVCRQTAEFKYDDWGRICPSFIAMRLDDIATHLEAAAAPKPSLREAAVELADCVDRCIRSRMEPGPDGAAASALAALREALAREEASKS